MSQYPRRVLSSFYLIWDVHGAVLPLFVRAGTVVDVVPGSKLEAAYGSGNLSPVIPPGDPKRTDQFGAQTFSKSALSN